MDATGQSIRENGDAGIRVIDPELRLVPYYPAEEKTLPWYQDAELCRQVDNRACPYTFEQLRRMYSFLNASGDCYYIEYRGNLAGDVTLRDNAEVCIVVCRECQNLHIGRRCVTEILKLAREKGLSAVKANIYTFNEQSRAMFRAAGFHQTEEEWFECRLEGRERNETRA